MFKKLKTEEGSKMVHDKKEVYITKDGLNEIIAELDILKKEKRPAIIKEIKEARALGDLSENADYHAAREEQGYVEGRIQDLEYMVENVKIIEEKHSDKVKLGTTVIIKYLSDNETETYKIVGSIEADPFENKISNESPIAKAIMDKKVGTVSTVESPNGKYDIEILEIK
jgi:transcription elongation factor GreA